MTPATYDSPLLLLLLAEPESESLGLAESASALAAAAARSSASGSGRKNQLTRHLRQLSVVLVPCQHGVIHETEKRECAYKTWPHWSE